MFHKTASCPSPSLAHSNVRGGLSPALRYARPPPVTVGRGPVPRHASVYRTVAGETRSDARVASEGPRATVKKTPPLHVGRGPVPRHAAIAGETRSDARVASEGPRATMKKRFLGP